MRRCSFASRCHGLRIRGYSEVRLSGGTWFGTQCEDRHSGAGSNGPFVGVAEVVCALMLLIGLLTRLAALIDMRVALLFTKVPILIGRGSMLHEARTDLSMLFALIFSPMTHSQSNRRAEGGFASV